ncbi:beta-ketoacyl synthase N-terminal-like domain-containing protein [Rossellomorea oryzaecorticis]|uniref:Beta-ketoacyl synthase N-terminal-like domain-containing protein n=1 Tax=Rossellomorea oryzaecorticis TaxID=1396505 RepID=A0ABU9K3Q4_9BACI
MNSSIESTDIAIIGMAGRFPGANTPREFWEHLKNATDFTQTFQDHQLLANGITEEQINNPEYKKVGIPLEEIEMFDADFFGYTPYEAKVSDPQHRIFLESVWEAIENSGYAPSKYTGRIGLFGSTSMSSYLINNILPNEEVNADGVNYPVLIGNDKDFLSTRISYKLNLKGPSITVQTACSSSLVAIHYAVQSILNGESDIALAGGVSVSVPQKTGYLYKEGGILSRDGRCRPFDEKASGTVKGNGCGVVVLKSLSEAIRDNDTIYSVIKSTAINNDGADKIGFTAPSVQGQESVIEEALFQAGISPSDVGYIETHGTGTSLGDPIEVQALNRMYGGSVQKQCALGSVKANIGHTDAAAGIIGLMKASMSLQHQTVVPTPNFENENKNLFLDKTPFYIADRLEQKNLNYAAVSSFGIGGTNAHVILQHWSQENSKSTADQSYVFPLSAKNNQSLIEMKNRLRNELERNPHLFLGDVAYTLANGRTEFSTRFAAVAGSKEELIEQLTSEITANDEKTINVSFEQGYNSELWEEALTPQSLFQDEISQILKECSEIDPEVTQISLLTETKYKKLNHFIYNLVMANKLINLGVSPELVISHNKIEDLVSFVLGDVITLEQALYSLLTKQPIISKNDAANSLYSLLCSDGKYYEKIGKDQILESTTLPDTEDVQASIGVSKSYSLLCFSGMTLSGIQHDSIKKPYNRFLQIVGSLWKCGLELAWECMGSHKRVPLPTYPFQKQRYWIDRKTVIQTNQPARLEDNNDIIRTVLDTWKKYLEVDSVLIDDNYYDLGGDSLAAVEIVSELRDLLKVKISIDQFTEMETPEELISFIEEQKNVKVKHPIIKKIREITECDENLFLIHPAGGNNLCYSQLNRCIKNFNKNIYVISYPNGVFNNESLEEISSYYLEAIEDVQPEGPYQLGGYSFGGNVAFEMALQLQKNRKQVETLILFDSHTPEAYFGNSITHKYFVNAFPLVLDMYLHGKKVNVQQLEAYRDQTLDEVIESIIEREDRKLTHSELSDFFKVWKHNHNALKGYFPRRAFNGDILFIEALETESDEVLELLKIKRVNKQVWKNHISGDLKIYKAPGDHYSMFGDPANVKKLAELVEETAESLVIETGVLS